MKRTITAITLFTLLLTGSATPGFVQNRYQWWKIRHQRLNEEKARLVKAGLDDRRILDLVDAEITDAVEILSVYEKKLNNDGSLTYIRKEITPELLHREIENLVPQLFALWYCETLVNDAGSQESLEEAKKAVSRVLGDKLAERFGAGSEELAALILREDISLNQWKNLSMEYFIERMMLEQGAAEKAIIAETTAAVREQLHHTGGRATVTELRGMILSAANARMENRAAAVSRISKRALKKSWSWNGINARVERQSDIYSDIINMMKISGRVSFDRIRHLHKNPAELESLVFSGSNERHLFPGHVDAARKDNDDESALTLVIPVLPRNRASLLEMESLRKRAVESITGKEKREYFTELEKEFNRIIGKNMNRTNRVFIHEEERMRILKEKSGEGELQVGNLETFDRAKKIFRNRLHLLYHYKKSSLEFVNWVHDSKKIISSEVVDQYRYQAGRSRDYGEFVAGLVRMASLAPASDNETYKRLLVSVQRSENIFQSIEHALSLDHEYYPYMNEADASEIRVIKGSLVKEINLARYDVKKSYTAFLRRKAEAKRKEREVLDNLESKIAQHEVDLMLDNALRYSSKYRDMNYLEEAFSDYVLKYRELERQARMDHMTADLKTALRQRSIIPVVDGFDDRKLAGEIRVAGYLKTGARAALARLGAIVQYYKRNRIEIEGYPGADEINAIQGMINRSIVVPVAEWRMHEQNYHEIDRKAMQKLADIVRRNIWLSRASGDGDDEDTAVSVKLAAGECSLTIPRGWSEQNTGEVDKYRGVLRTYISMDNESSIRLVQLPVKRLTPKEITERWLRENGETLVKKEWTRKGDRQFLRVLSRDGNDTVTETYSLERNGLVILVSGQTTRSKYMLFKNKLDSVIESLRL